jgi:hypothetical protein
MEQAEAISCNFTQCDPSQITCGVTPTEHCYDIACSDNCSCLTESQALSQGYHITDRCRTCSCDNNTPHQKYCYPKWSSCNTTCGTCMLDNLAATFPTLTMCPDTTPCAPPSQGSMHCYTMCPSPCNCVKGVFPSDNLTQCDANPCPSRVPGFGSAFCYKCPDGCECKADNDTDIANYTPCYTGKCGEDPAYPKHCYKLGHKSGTSGGGCTPPQIGYFSSTTTQISAGEQVTLSWSITGSGSAFLICGGAQQSVPLAGTTAIKPSQSGCCTLSVKNECGSDQKTVCTTVVPPPVNEPVGGCCANGRVGQATQSQCAQIGGQWYRSLSEATQACQPPTCWCCANGRVSQVTQSQCAQMGGACYSDQSQATKACQPVTCWCCANGRVYQTTQPQCAQMGGACYNDQGQATKACQQAPTPPRDTR